MLYHRLFILAENRGIFWIFIIQIDSPRASNRRRRLFYPSQVFFWKKEKSWTFMAADKVSEHPLLIYDFQSGFLLYEQEWRSIELFLEAQNLFFNFSFCNISKNLKQHVAVFAEAIYFQTRLIICNFRVSSKWCGPKPSTPTNSPTQVFLPKPPRTKKKTLWTLFKLSCFKGKSASSF